MLETLCILQRARLKFMADDHIYSSVSSKKAKAYRLRLYLDTGRPCTIRLDPRWNVRSIRLSYPLQFAMHGKISCLLRMFRSAEIVASPSAALGPCQSNPHSVLPGGRTIQLEFCRGIASAQNVEANISTPAPSTEQRWDVLWARKYRTAGRLTKSQEGRVRTGIFITFDGRLDQK